MSMPLNLILLVFCALSLASSTALAISSASANRAAAGFAEFPWDYQAELLSAPVFGTLPDWLAGTFYRTSVAKFDYMPYSNRSTAHWFMGLALMHSFTFHKGMVDYRARFVESAVYNATHPAPAPPVTSPWSLNTGVTVRRVAGHILVNTEDLLCNEIAPVTLDMVQLPFLYNDSVGLLEAYAPAHAAVDPAGNTFHFYQTRVGGANGYIPFTVDAGTTTRRFGSFIPTPPEYQYPMFHHSLGMSERFMVLSEIPCESDLSDGFRSVRFHADRPVIWRLIDRKSLTLVRTFQSPAFFTFHHINAYDDAATNSLVVDLFVAPDNAALDALYLEEILTKPGDAAAAASKFRPMRFVLPLDAPEGATVQGKMLADVNMELATIRPSLSTLRHRYVYGISYQSEDAAFFDAVTKLDTETGTYIQRNASGFSPFGQGATFYPMEPIFVPRPDGSDEDDGVLLVIALQVDGPSNRTSSSSFLRVYDGKSLETVADVALENFIIPFGFHGFYFEQ